MPALSFLNSTGPLHPKPSQPPLDARTNDQTSRFGVLALSAVTASLAAATLVITYRQLRLQIRGPGDTATSVEGDAAERESDILEGIIGSRGQKRHSFE
jgi:hypothetical protein